jgi:hypothetical protein
MQENRILQLIGALVILIAVAAVWHGTGTFFQWASAPSAEHVQNHDSH